jgi:hypothetical protein
VKRTEFESITLEQGRARAEAEPDPERGKPKYFGRLWAQIVDEMTAAGASTIGDLPEQRVTDFFNSSGAVYGELSEILKTKQESDESGASN